MAHRQDVGRNDHGTGRQDAVRSPLRFARLPFRTILQRVSFLFLAIVVLAGNGCSTCRLPAIDPTGNRILSGDLTQLTLPRIHASTQNVGVVPTPGFREPPPPPACLQGPSIAPTARPVGHKVLQRHHKMDDRGRCGQLLLTPTRIVAPVNGDVVLMSGICGEDGYLVTGETIEWMIAPDSVGHIVEVGDDGSTSGGGLFHGSTESAVQKLGIDFARGVTASNENVVTRGSAKLTDDLLIKRGQTWVSLTSPTEGITRITALAPDAEVWDRRRQTATIYWVDARWQFPPPAQQAGTAPVQLMTRVTRAEGFAPAEGWIVRYRSQDPTIALFNGQSQTAEVQVDASGIAATPINNVAGRSGSALITIEVIRPAQASENMPQLTLGTGQTVVSWTAAELVLQAAGPSAASVNEVLNYTVTISNLGTLPAENVRLTMPIPNGMRVVSASQTPTQQTNAELAWDVRQVPAQQQLVITLQLQPTVESDYRVQFVATTSSGTPQTQVVATLVSSPKMSLRFLPAAGSEQVEVGALVQTELVVTNNGRTALNNIAVTVESEPGLQSINDQANLVRRIVAYLGPGESQVLNPAFNARQVGPLRATAIASINEVELARQTMTVQAVAPATREPKLSLQFQTASGTERIATGAEERVGLVITNTGQIPLQNIQATLTHSASLAPTSASQGFTLQESQRQINWLLASLAVGESVTVQAVFKYDGTETNPQLTGTVVSAPQLRESAVLNFQPIGGASTGGNVLPPSNVLPNNNVLPGQNNSAQVLPESLNIKLEPVRNRTNANTEMRYLLAISNSRNNPDQNVQITLQLQPGLELREVTTADGQRVTVNYASDGSSATFETIRYLAPRETIQYYLTVRHGIPGNWAMRASALSSLSATGVEATSTVEVVN